MGAGSASLGSHRNILEGAFSTSLKDLTMALLALAAPTSAQLATPQGVNLSGTALGANTGATIPWVPGLCIAVLSGATAAGAVTLLNPNGSPTFASPVVTLAASGVALFGVVDQVFSNSSGLVQVNVAVVTTAQVAAFLVPTATGAAHSPFANLASLADY